jgi:hypothetical protein
MTGEHLNANRVWTLIRDSGTFTSQETTHLKSCAHCNEWVAGFVNLARKAGFKINLQIPASAQRPAASGE